MEVVKGEGWEVEDAGEGQAEMEAGWAVMEAEKMAAEVPGMMMEERWARGRRWPLRRP